MEQFVFVPASLYNKSKTTQESRNFQSIKRKNLPRTNLIL